MYKTSLGQIELRIFTKKLKPSIDILLIFLLSEGITFPDYTFSMNG